VGVTGKVLRKPGESWAQKKKMERLADILRTVPFRKQAQEGGIIWASGKRIGERSGRA